MEGALPFGLYMVELHIVRHSLLMKQCASRLTMNGPIKILMIKHTNIQRFDTSYISNYKKALLSLHKNFKKSSALTSAVYDFNHILTCIVLPNLYRKLHLK